MDNDKNPQQIDWGDSMDDWDSQSWAEHTRYGGDNDPDTDYIEEPVVNDDFEYWRALKENREYSRRNADPQESKKMITSYRKRMMITKRTGKKWMTSIPTIQNRGEMRIQISRMRPCRALAAVTELSEVH